MNFAAFDGFLKLLGGALIVSGVTLRFGAPWALITAGALCIGLVVSLRRGPTDGS